LALFCITGAGCADARSRAGVAAEDRAFIVDPPARGEPRILIAMPDSANFLDVRKSLVSEIQKSFDVVTFIVTPGTAPDDMASAVQRVHPVCLVLMNNATMSLMAKYESNHPEQSIPPTVLLMASLIEELQSTLKRATGIAYEVPGVTAFVNLRSIIRGPVTRVGVIYRPALRRFVERQRGPAAKEHIEMVSVAVASEVGAEGLRDALDTLVKDQNVDAVWMLNDNALVRDARFRDEAWRAELNESNVPLIVGAANLVNPAFPLGTLAVVPDHEALGLQASNLIFELAEDRWNVEAHPVELPLSVKTVVDIKMVRDRFGLRPDALKHVDRAIE
jgi:putative ABC transport system substrate-binding protein